MSRGGARTLLALTILLLITLSIWLFQGRATTQDDLELVTEKLTVSQIALSSATKEATSAKREVSTLENQIDDMSQEARALEASNEEFSGEVATLSLALQDARFALLDFQREYEQATRYCQRLRNRDSLEQSVSDTIEVFEWLSSGD